MPETHWKHSKNIPFLTVQKYAWKYLTFLLKRWGLLCIKMFPSTPVILQRFRLLKICPNQEVNWISYKKNKKQTFAAFKKLHKPFCKVTSWTIVSSQICFLSQSTVRFSAPCSLFCFEEDKMHRSSRYFSLFFVVRFKLEQ